VNDLLQTVIGHTEAHPDDLCVRLVSSRGGEIHSSATRTWADVTSGAARSAAFLATRGVRRGDVVVLIGTHHPDFPANWLGCVWLGAVPTVLAEPSVRVDREVYWSRLRALLERVDARALVTDPSVTVDASWPAERPRFTYEETASHEGAAVDPVRPQPSDLLLLQHSSGTTGLQKGVMLSHGAVMRHAAAYEKALGIRGDEVVASWLPLYHDMGLIACFITPLCAGLPVVWLSPFEWVVSPASLLHAVTRWRATHVWLPNFAFSFLAQRVREPRGTFDLSSLRATVNCSEPVTAEAMDAFADRFAADGFDRSALHACYAMAENIYAVTSSTDQVPARRRLVDRAAWHATHAARAAADGASAEDTIVHVSNGVPVEGCSVRIGPIEGGPGSRPANEAGRVWIRSPFLFDGYYRRPDLQPDLFAPDGFYDTGDVGYVDEAGHLYVTGRLKEMVIVGGRNVYPHDVEGVVGDVPGVHPGRVVAFGVPHRGLGTEGLVVLLESDEPEAEWPQVVRRVRQVVPARLDLDLLDVRVVARGSLRKSTSGKLARGGNREWYLGGRFGAVPMIVDTSVEKE
jgi:fatty-acyl-CoA synthase